ncbi:hypothetical protein CaCOL14_003743 [Colletotrichum acutatum]
MITHIEQELQDIERLMERLNISFQSNETEVVAVAENTSVQSAFKARSASSLALDNEIGLFGKDKLQVFVDELRICKQTVSLALAAANFLASIDQTKQLQAILNRLQANDGDVHSEAMLQDSRDLIRGYEELQASLLIQVNERRSKLTVGQVKVLESQAVIGIHGADGTDGELDVQLVKVEGQGFNLLVGYSKGVDLNAAFFKKDK